MALEIEHKFLVDYQKWSDLIKSEGQFYRQGYLVMDTDKTVRVRLGTKQAYLTIKGATSGVTRNEFEYEIPLEEGKELLALFGVGELSKTRYTVHYAHKLWEVDVFHGANEGLIVAEIELHAIDELFELPDWVTIEVTDDARYYNSNLAAKPFTQW